MASNSYLNASLLFDASIVTSLYASAIQLISKFGRVFILVPQDWKTIWNLSEVYQYITWNKLSWEDQNHTV